MEILEKLAARFAARKATANETIVAAARRAAAGESVDTGAVEAALVETGTTLDAFAAMVELQRRRAGWAEAVGKRAAAEARRVKAAAALEAAREAFENTAAEYRQKAGRLSAEVADAESIVAAADTAAANLRDPNNLAGNLADDLRAAQAERDAAAAAASRIQRDLNEWRGHEKRHAESRDHKAEFGGNEHGDAADHERLRKQAVNHVNRLEAEHTAAAAVVADVEKRIAALEAAALKQ